jgi:hypothetical protein
LHRSTNLPEKLRADCAAEFFQADDTVVILVPLLEQLGRNILRRRLRPEQAGQAKLRARPS